MYFKKGKPTGNLDDYLNTTVRIKIKDDLIKLNAIGILKEAKRELIDAYVLELNDMDISVEFTVSKAKIIFNVDDTDGYGYPTIKVTPEYIS